MRRRCVCGSPCVGSKSACVCGERDLGEGDEIGLCGSSVPVHTGRLDRCVQWWKAGSLSIKVSVVWKGVFKCTLEKGLKRALELLCEKRRTQGGWECVSVST